MAELGSLEVSLSLNAANFNGSIAQVNRQMTAMGSELRALQARGTEYSSSLAGLGQKQDILSRQFDASGVKLREQRQRYDELVASGTATEAQLERQANAVNRAQVDYNRLERELAEVTEALRVQSSQWTQAGQRMQEAGTKMKSVGDGITSIGKNLSMKVTAPIAALGAASFKAAVDFESAFAGVRKTVDTTEEGFAKLEQGIRDMAKAGPTSATELASIMEMAGQLGVAEANLLSFTSVMSDLSTATNMTAEQAATEFARFANITGMAQTDFDKMGSSIVALGNNFATTESEISAMAMRLAGAGAQIGLSESDILGLSAALTSVGIEAEMGGSAISKVMVNMQVASSAGFKGVQELSEKTGMSLREMQLMASNNSKGFTKMAESLGMTKTELNNTIKAGANLEGFSKVAGMTGEQFVQAFEKDAIGALGAFINGLGNAESAGESAINMLQEMGITEVRLRDSLLRAGNANELFAEAINMSSDAWEENTALANEAAQRYATTASQLETLKNKVVDIGISLGEILIPMVLSLTKKIEPWIEKFSQLSTETQKNILLFGGLAAAIGPVLIVGGTLISTTGTILTAVGGLATAIGSAGGVVALLSAKLGFLTPVLGALSGPIGWTALGIAAIGTAAVVVGKEMSESSIQIQNWSDGVSEATADAVGAFVTISDEVGQSLSNLHLTSTTITGDLATDLTGKFEAMYSQIVEAANTKHQEQMDSLSNYFLNSSALTSEEEAKILEKRQQAHATEIEILSAKNQIVADIMAAATEEKRALTDHEREVINNINQQMKEDAVRVLSENEVEQKVILEKMKADASEISALQAAEVVKNAVEQKEKVIEEANKQYEESIAHITRLRDETGDISAEQADRMIAEAKKSRDQTIYYAEEMHENIVSEAKAQAGEHVNQVEWETGEIKSKWKQLGEDIRRDWSQAYSDVIKKMKETRASIKKDWSEVYADTKKSVSDIAESVNEKFSEFGKNIGIKMNEAKDYVVNKWNEAKDFLKAIDLKAIGNDIVQGLINGITEKINGVTQAAKDLGQSIIDSVSNVLQRRSPSRVMIAIGKDVGEGLAIGVDSTQQRNETAAKELGQLLIDATKSSQEEITGIASKAEKERKLIQNDAAKEKKKLEEKLTSDIYKIQLSRNKKTKTLTTKQTYQIQLLKQTANDKLVKLEEDTQKKLDKINEKSLSEMIKKEESTASSRLKIIKQYISDKDSTNELSLASEEYILSESLKLFKEGTAERIEIQKMQKKVSEEIAKEETAINKAFVDNVNALDTEYIKNKKEITKQYEDTYNRRKNALYSFASLFEEITQKDVEGSSLINALQSQVTAFEDWAKNIGDLATRGIDEGLLAELREMGPKAGAEIAALNSLTDQQLQQYVDLWKQKNELARKQTEQELIGLKQNTEQQIKELQLKTVEQLRVYQDTWKNNMVQLKGNVKTEMAEMPNIGDFAVSGLINGMMSKQGDLMNAAQALADIVSSTFQTALDIHSPSRVMRGFGVNIVEGLVQGINSMAAHATTATKRISSAVTNGVVQTEGNPKSTATTENAEYHYHLEINSPKPLDPYETARLSKNGWKEMTLQMG